MINADDLATRQTEMERDADVATSLMNTSKHEDLLSELDEVIEKFLRGERPAMFLSRHEYGFYLSRTRTIRAYLTRYETKTRYLSVRYNCCERGGRRAEIVIRYRGWSSCFYMLHDDYCLCYLP